MVEKREEIDAMQAALEALEPLDEAGRRRAVKWLASRLEVELTVPMPVEEYKAMIDGAMANFRAKQQT